MGPDLPNGSVCYSGLTLGADGLFYGTCLMWNSFTDNGGIIFKYDPSQGQNGFTILYCYEDGSAGHRRKRH